MANNFFKIDKGVTLAPQASVSSPQDGDVYYDSTRATYVFRNNGQNIDLQKRTDIVSATNLTSSTLNNTTVQSSIIKITGSTVGNIHGLTASSDAKVIFIYNGSSQIQTIKNESGTEPTAGNRIVCPSSTDVSLYVGQAVQLIYDSSSTRWVVLSVSGSSGNTTVTTDTYSGTGSQTVFTLSSNPGDVNNILVYVHGVYQQKSTYSLSGTTLTFTTAPPAGANNIEVKYGINLAGAALPLSTPPTLVVFNSGSGNYVPSANTKYIKFQLWGGGGGGAGSARGSSNDATNGGAGGSSTFGLSTAGGGGGGFKGLTNTHGIGGTATLGGDVTYGFSYSGQNGNAGGQGNSNNGVSGGDSHYLAGRGHGGAGQSVGGAALANTGAGGGSGGGTAEVSASYVGGGGGAGGYVEGYINNPGTISYSIGSGGSAGSGGTGPGFAGGAGAGGKLIIWEYK